MPRLKSSSAATRRRGSKTQLVMTTPAQSAAQCDGARRSGIKLSTVSTVVLLFAMLCLAAFAAGRPPISAADFSSPGAPAGIGAKEQTMFLGLRTAVYQAADLRKAKAWYEAVLGVKPYFDQPFYAGFNVKGYELGIVPSDKSGEKRHAAGIAYWGVSDARAAYERLLKLGATPVEPVQDVGEGILVGAVHDPFGNVLGVIQNPHFKVADQAP